MRTIKVKSFRSLGVKDTLDLEVDHPDHNFYAEGMVTSNSHAAAYGALAAICAYLKFNHPKEFFLALLRMEAEATDAPIGVISREMKQFGIQLLPPHLLKSGINFTIEGDNIRYGLKAIKGVSEKVIESLVKFRETHDSKLDCFMAAKQAKINIGTLSALIQAGTLSDLSTSRSRLVLEAQLWNILSPAEQRRAKDLFENTQEQDLLKIVKAMATPEKDGKPLIKASRFETIKKKYTPYKAIYQMNSKNEPFANYIFERELLGFAYSGRLIDVFTENEEFIPIGEIKSDYDNTTVTYVGFVESVWKKTAKSGKKFIKFLVTDESGAMSSMCFDNGSDFAGLKMDNDGRIPEVGDVVAVSGRKKSGDTVFANHVVCQSGKVYMKLRDLPDEEESK